MRLWQPVQERFEAIKEALHPFLKQCGFQEDGLQWLPAAAPSGLSLINPTAVTIAIYIMHTSAAGENIVGPPSAPELACWWRGLCVAEAIDAFRMPARRRDAPLRIGVSSSGKGARGGLLASGKIECGSVKVLLELN